MSKKQHSENVRQLLAHVSLALKSFDLTVSTWDSQTVLGHLQSLYKKKKYIFYVVKDLSSKEVKGIKFEPSIKYCVDKNYQFIVVCKSWDANYNDFAERNDYLWKIIPMDQLTKLGQEYIEAKEREQKLKEEEAWNSFKKVV